MLLSAHTNGLNLVVGEWENSCFAMWALLSPGAEQNGMGKVCCLVGALFRTARTGCARCVKWQVKQDGVGQGHPSLCNGSIFLAR